jgi:DNA-binding transcriptional LysR family regulator
MKIKDVDDLRVLIHTAHTGSLTGAAVALEITPAAASAMLKRLEAQLGVRLFERSTRAMRLTPSGQALLDYARRVFDLVAEGEAQVTADRAGLVGLIRIGAPSDLARTRLLPWLDEFIALYPDVELSLSVGDRMVDVIRDEVDLVIRYGELVDSRLVARCLLPVEPVVVAAPSYLERHPIPQSPMDLTHHNCLAYERGGRPYRTWRFNRDGHALEVRVNGNCSVDDASLARQWAIAGAGVLLKSPVEQMQDMAEGRLVRLLGDWHTETYPLNALLPSGRFVPKRVHALVDFLVAKFQRLAADLDSLMKSLA